MSGLTTSETENELLLRVAQAACHEEQMTVWSSDFAGALGTNDYLRDLSYDEVAELHQTIQLELQRIIASAMQHPEVSRVLREAAEGWRPICEEARQADRIQIAWAPFGNIPEHVELGWWSDRAQAWVNTYGKPFSGEPDAWMPLPAYPLPSPPASASAEPTHDQR